MKFYENKLKCLFYNYDFIIMIFKLLLYASVLI